MECTECKYRKQIPLKRCKHFELGGDKKRKVNYKNSFYMPEFSFKVLIFNILLFSGTNDSVLNDLFYAMFCIFNKK